MKRLAVIASLLALLVFPVSAQQSADQPPMPESATGSRGKTLMRTSQQGVRARRLTSQGRGVTTPIEFEEPPMQTIFVQFKCRPGRAYDVADRLVQDVEEISEVYSTSGHYDLIAKFYLPDSRDIGHFVTERLQVADGVQDTFTTVAFKAFGAA